MLGALIAAAEATASGAALQLRSGQRLECLAVVGADGVRSAVAAAAGRPAPNYCGQSAIRRAPWLLQGAAADVYGAIWLLDALAALLCSAWALSHSADLPGVGRHCGTQTSAALAL